MPELPEVEAAKRLVDSHCLGGVILKAFVADDVKVIDGVTPAALQEALTGKVILSAHRKGKHLWLHLDSPPWPSFQFGMSGAIIVKGVKGPTYKSSKMSDTEEFPSNYWKVHLQKGARVLWELLTQLEGHGVMQLDNGVEVAFTDKRRFARVRLLEDPAKVPPISELGLDAYLELPSTEKLGELIRTKKGAIKALLLDQSFLAGIGNWVGDEVLYQSNIHPEQSASSLKEEECTRLHTAIKEVLDKAVSVDADSEQFPGTWIFNHRWDRKPGLINGNQIETITISGRTSAYVPNVQKYTGPELKGAKRKAIVAEDMPHEGEPEANENIDPATDDALVDKEVTGGKASTPETKRGRGRPPKTKVDYGAKSVPPTPAPATEDASPAGAKKRGRPPKLKTAASPVEEKKEVKSEEKKEVNSEGKNEVKNEGTNEEKTEGKNEGTNEGKNEGTNEGKTDAEEIGKESPGEPKRRGRPPKAKVDASKEAVSKALEEAPAKVEKAMEVDDAAAKDDKDDRAAEEGEDTIDDAPPEKKDGHSSPITPKRRGRPPKAKPEATEELEITKKAKVGNEEEVTGSPAAAGSAEPKRRGRPPKAKPDPDAKEVDTKEDEGKGSTQVADTATPTPKKRGRPPRQSLDKLPSPNST